MGFTVTCIILHLLKRHDVLRQVCSECQEDKSASAYHRSKSYNDGLYGKCKRCCAAALSRRRAQNEAAAAEYSEPQRLAAQRSSRRQQHQHQQRHFPLHGPQHQQQQQQQFQQPTLQATLAAGDIGSMLSDASLGDSINRVSKS